MGPFPNDFNPQQMIQMAMQQNPSLQNNPQAQNIIQVLMSGDAQAGEQLARNYCKSYGVTPEEGARQAQQFFQQMFQGPNQRR